MDCPKGFYCRDIGITDNFTPCPKGFYCLAGQKDPQKCLAGTYNPTTHAYLPEHCLPCPPGKYCASDELPAPSGDCDPGYFCYEGSKLKAPQQMDDTNDPPNFGPCEEGEFCDAGTPFPNKCPPGTYNDQKY